MFADENMIQIKHDVLYEVAKLAFADELEEKRDWLPEMMIPGPTPRFRCCIYKERDYPSAYPSGGGEGPWDGGRREYHPGDQRGLRGLSDFLLYGDGELPELCR